MELLWILFFCLVVPFAAVLLSIVCSVRAHYAEKKATQAMVDTWRLENRLKDAIGRIDDLEQLAGVRPVDRSAAAAR